MKKDLFAGRETYNVIRFTVFFFRFTTRLKDYISFTFANLKINTLW
ncbi:hypothetical protein CSC02_0508 [Enterobacter hormaechei subsp. hoffmannii]|nr:hypothetical protein CSC02_0508 [Enterobacter hormaechei subsp. hoffmannii]